VRPPIIWDDVVRGDALTPREPRAQSATPPGEGMLTGPVTILNWSFPAGSGVKDILSSWRWPQRRDRRPGGPSAAIQVDEPGVGGLLPGRTGG
jgi:hypothetical protein